MLPQITVQGLGLNFGGPSAFPQGRTDTTFVLSDTLSYQRGEHSFKFGGEYRRFHNENFQTNGGTFSFPSLTAFQTGVASAFTATLGEIASDITQNAVGLFVQDNFRVRSNLTLELGVRYELNVSPTEADDNFVYFDPASASLYQVGQGPRDKVYENKSNFLPRIGVVWDPSDSGRTVFRAAYAITADQPVTNLVTPTAAQPAPGDAPDLHGPRIRLDNAIDVAGPAGLAPSSVDAGFRNPTVQTWNVNVQRRGLEGLPVMVGYFGSKGEHLRVLRNLNQITNGVRPFPRLADDSPIRPGATLGNIIQGTSLGRSRYDGLWVTLNKRFAGGLQFNGSYTLSKSKDTNSLSSQGVVGLQDSTNVDGDFALSDYDARHRFVLSGLWELPFKGNQLKEGWQISVVTQGQTGNPINVVTNLGNTGVINSVRPDLVGISTSPARRNSGSPTGCATRASRLLHVELGLRPAVLARRRLPFREPRAQLRDRAGLLQHRSLDHQEDEGGRGHRGVPGRGLQRLQPPEPRPAGPDRHSREHQPRRDHRHSPAHRRLGLGAAAAVRAEVDLLSEQGGAASHPPEPPPSVVSGWLPDGGLFAQAHEFGVTGRDGDVLVAHRLDAKRSGQMVMAVGLQLQHPHFAVFLVGNEFELLGRPV